MTTNTPTPMCIEERKRVSSSSNGKNGRLNERTRRRRLSNRNSVGRVKQKDLYARYKAKRPRRSVFTPELVCSRVYTSNATENAKKELAKLLANTGEPKAYQQNMRTLGKLLAETILSELRQEQLSDILIVSTAEDADYLQCGVWSELHENEINTKLAVFWNHHYKPYIEASSVAPVVHKFVEKGYESTEAIIIVKSIMSGSCVVRANLIEMLDKVNKVDNIYILSPVAHVDSEKKLRKEFPTEIAEKFKFVCFAKDRMRNEEGEVIPGIGGQIYSLLGLSGQPVLSSYMPKVVEKLVYG